jgi:hypothetical protein
MREADRPPRKGVDAGRGLSSVSVRPQVVSPERVHRDEDDVDRGPVEERSTWCARFTIATRTPTPAAHANRDLGVGRESDFRIVRIIVSSSTAATDNTTVSFTSAVKRCSAMPYSCDSR